MSSPALTLARHARRPSREPPTAGRPRACRGAASSRCSTSSPSPHAAAPTLRLHLHVIDPRGARSTRSRCRSRSRSTPRGALRRRHARAARRAVRVPRALGLDDPHLPVGPRRRARAAVLRRDLVRARDPVHLRPRGRGEQVHLLAARTGIVPLQFNFSGTVLYRGDRRTGCASSRCRGAARRAGSMPVEAWQRRDGRLLPRRRLGAADDRDARSARRAQGRGAAATPTTPASPSCSRRRHERPPLRADRAASGAGAHAALRGLRALPVHARARRRTRRRRRSGSSTRRSTPRRARRRPSTACACRSSPSTATSATLRATVVFLEPAGERHQGVERRIELGPAPLDGDARRRRRSRSTPFAGASGMSAELLRAAGSPASASACTTRPSVGEGLDRPAALRASLLSTHVSRRSAAAASSRRCRRPSTARRR